MNIRKKRPAVGKSARSESRIRPALESLENRTLLTSVVVNSISDTATGGGIVTLRDAINTADTSSTPTAITFDPTVFAAPQTIVLSGTQLVLSNTGEPTTITGPVAGVTISGNNASRILAVDLGVTTSLQGVSIINGTTTSAGGGIVNAGALTIENASISGNSSGEGGGGIQNQASLTLMNVTISNNVANGHGGGLENYGAATGNAIATLTDVTLSGNSTTTAGGGGIASDINGLSGNTTLTLNNVTVNDNTSVANGGGILLDSSNVGTSLTGVTIEDNSAVDDGGGIANLGGTATATDATVSDNTATSAGTSRGGGIYNSGSLVVSDSTLSGNTTPFYGGAVDIEGGAITLVNDTISGNTAGGNGGVNDGANSRATLENVTVSGNTALGGSGVGPGAGGAAVDSAFGATLSIANSIIAGNTNLAGATEYTDVASGFTSLGFNLIGEIDGSTGWTSGDLTGTAAKPLNADLGALANNGGPTETLLPLTGSPAIGAGSVALVPAGITTDQRGLPRIVNGAVDIGAVEVQPGTGASIMVTASAAQTATAGVSQSFSLGSFSQSNASGPYSVNVNWGDGTPDSQFTQSSTGTIAPQSHTFANAAAETVRVTVTDAQNDTSNVATFAVTVNPVVPLPAATINAPNVNAGGGSSEILIVTYTATSGAINLSTIAGSNLTVTSPGGVVLVVIVFNTTISNNGDTVTVTYTVAPPGGTWTAADNGTYTVAINAGAVQDVNGVGNAAASTSFSVNATTDLVVTVSTSNEVANNGQSITFIAIVSTGSTGGSTPTGTVSFYNGGTLLGTAPVGSDGQAMLTAGAMPTGNYAITANYSGDSTYPAVYSALPLKQAVTPMLPVTSKVSGTLPKKVVAGQKVKINQTVTISNLSGALFTGPVTINIYLSTDSTMNSQAIQLQGPISKQIKLKNKGRTTVRITITGLPDTVTTGTYYIIIVLTGSGGATTTAAAPKPVAAQSPMIDLSGAIHAPMTDKIGKTVDATLDVTNNGNIEASGPLLIDISSSQDMMLADATQVMQLTKTINLKPGKSTKFEITGLALPPTAGTYYLIVQLDPNNTFNDLNLANNTFVSAAVTVG